jgi:ApaG protein
MSTAITEGIQVSVRTHFRPDLSDLGLNRFFFNYRVEMVNHNPYPVQLLSRDWFIFDSLEDASYLTGEGVVGEQPVLDPGQRFSYMSGCELNSEIGSMHGFYTFRNLKSGDLLQVNIPLFHLYYPGKLN